MNLVRRIGIFSAASVLVLAISAVSLADVNSVRDCAEAKSAATLLSSKAKLLSGPEIARIDVRAEYSAFNLAALKLRTLARFGRCDLHLAEINETYNVRATDGTNDEFEVSEISREVITWKHSLGRSPASETHFSSRGEVDFIR